MNETRDPKKDEKFFAGTSQYVFMILKTPALTTQKQALEFIDAYDKVIDEITEHMKDSGDTYSSHTILLFGSVLGEAFRKAIGGNWTFSDEYKRWVVAYNIEKGPDVEVNVFDMVEKRIENGMEHSIGRHFKDVQDSLSEKTPKNV